MLQRLADAGGDRVQALLAGRLPGVDQARAAPAAPARARPRPGSSRRSPHVPQDVGQACLVPGDVLPRRVEVVPVPVGDHDPGEIRAGSRSPSWSPGSGHRGRTAEYRSVNAPWTYFFSPAGPDRSVVSSNPATVAAVIRALISLTVPAAIDAALRQAGVDEPVRHLRAGHVGQQHAGTAPPGRAGRPPGRPPAPAAAARSRPRSPGRRAGGARRGSSRTRTGPRAGRAGSVCRLRLGDLLLLVGPGDPRGRRHQPGPRRTRTRPPDNSRRSRPGPSQVIAAPGAPGCLPRLRFFSASRSAARRCLRGGLRPGVSSRAAASRNCRCCGTRRAPGGRSGPSVPRARRLAPRPGLQARDLGVPRRQLLLQLRDLLIAGSARSQPGAGDGISDTRDDHAGPARSSQLATDCRLCVNARPGLRHRRTQSGCPVTGVNVYR